MRGEEREERSTEPSPLPLFFASGLLGYQGDEEQMGFVSGVEKKTYLRCPSLAGLYLVQLLVEQVQSKACTYVHNVVSLL